MNSGLESTGINHKTPIVNFIREGRTCLTIIPTTVFLSRIKTISVFGTDPSGDMENIMLWSHDDCENCHISLDSTVLTTC